jgi:hypothetical protein
MAPVKRMEHDELVEFLRSSSAEEGLTLVEFFELGSADALESANLRDLWLIYGPSLEEEDLKASA